MRFLYEYRTPDNEKHSGTINAADREAAYAALKRKGIKPCRFSEAPGFFNKLFGKGKRWMVIGVLGVLCGVLSLTVANVLRAQRSALRTISALRTSHSALPSLPRHQIANLPSNWPQFVDAVFTNDIDRLLARHSQPGVSVGKSGVVLAPPTDASWVGTLKSVVEGMRGEADGFLKMGRTVDDLERYLEERQRMEIAYRARTIQQIRSGEIGKVEANETLRAMELPLVE